MGKTEERVPLRKSIFRRQCS